MLRFAVLLAIGASLFASSSAPVRSTIMVTPDYTCPALSLHPRRSVISTNGDVVFNAVAGIRGSGFCSRGPAYGTHWKTNGGELFVYRGMAQAEFSAKIPGTYTVTGHLDGAVAHATVVVRP